MAPLCSARFLSTRDPRRMTHTFSDVLLRGLAPDGGLYLPEEYPTIREEQLTAWRHLLHKENGYALLAAEILTLFLGDDTPDDITALCCRAYRYPTFSDPAIVPVQELRALDETHQPLFLGRVSLGPTAAFKDMAMQLLGELFEYHLARSHSTLTIVGATSGDTGSSAEYALRGRANVRVFMLTPRGRMTPFQQAQMFSLPDDNIVNISFDGVFDDCQDAVKALFSDTAFAQRVNLGAVNSINWARLMAQIVYYVSSYLTITTTNDQRVSFSVPTGNFGDVCAGHIARMMGLPIDRLIVATNENDVLDEFFRTGNYRVRTSAETLATSSPSMDISKASNFERFVFDVLDRDSQATARLFGHDIACNGGFTLSPEILHTMHTTYGFTSARSTHNDRLHTIAQVYRQCGIVIDPHTADGVHAALVTRHRNHITTPIICLETALPVKFADTIAESLGFVPEPPERFAHIGSGPRYVTELPNDVDQLKKFIDTRS